MGSKAAPESAGQEKESGRGDEQENNKIGKRGQT
jgi:hypothetical protein